MDSNPGKTSTENIDEVILRLLKLKTGTELDYQTYAKKIKIKLASSRMVGAFIPAEEDILLREEFKRVRNKEGRFVILKSKKTKVSSPPPPSGSSGGGGSPPKTGSIVKTKSGKITADNYFYQNYVEPVNVKDVTKNVAKVSKQTDPLTRISDTLDSILNTLTNINKFDREQATRQRTDAENRRRGQRETDLESKPFEGIKKALSAITKPFQSIWDRIVNFITNVIFGRIIIKLLEWFGNSKNQEKIQSIIRFLGDHWPTLLALYLRFGTGIGRFVGKLGGILVKGAFKLVGLAAKLAVKAGIGKTGGKLSKVAGFLGGTKGKLLSAGLGIAADVAVTAGTSAAINKFAGGGGEKTSPVQQFSGGGAVRYPKFSGGGFAKFGNMFKGAGFGSMFGPLGMLAGAALGSGKPQEMFNGFVSGQSGVDKVPAMLTDGEFVMSTGAVQKYGVDTLEAMNAAGGGTNQPKVVGGKTYAVGGGRIGDVGNERYDLTPGFRGESSKSDIYLVRAVNELIKVLRNKFPDSGSSGSSGGSGGLSGGSGLPKQLENITNQIISGGSQLYQGAASVANSGYSLASRVAGEAAKKAKPAMSLASRVAGEAAKKAKPAMSLASRVAGAAAKKAKPAIQSIPSTIDYGSLYLRSQLGGFGGSITESDLSNQTQDEYKKAFARAKADSSNRMMSAQSVVNQYQQLLKGPNLTADQKKDFNNKLANAKGELAKYKRGLVNVEYSDFKDEKGRLSPAAEAAQKTLGAVWASQEKDGGIKIAKEPYDFPLIKDPIGLMRWKTLSKEEKLSWLDKQNPSSAVKRKLDPRNGGSFGKWGKQDIAEAMYTLNPFATPVETDVKIGGKPRPKGILDKVTNMLDNPLLSMGRGLGMNLLKGKERNVVTGEAEKDSLWNKIFPSKKTDQKQKESEKLRSTGMGGKYIPGSQQKQIKPTQPAQVSKSSNPKTPVKPLPRPKPKPIVAGGGMGGRRGSRSRPSSGSKTPSFNAQHSKGTFVSASAYGIKR